MSSTLSQIDISLLPQLEPTEQHIVLCNAPIKGVNKPPEPRAGWVGGSSPLSRTNSLPCALLPCFDPSSDMSGKTSKGSHWERIVQALTPVDRFQTIKDLTSAIQRYNQSVNLDNLEYVINLCKIPERKIFFNELLPATINLALLLPSLFPEPFPLLESGRPMALTLSQLQVACLVANMFLCTFYPYQRRVNFELTPSRRASVSDSSSNSFSSPRTRLRQTQLNEWPNTSSSQKPASKPVEKKTSSPRTQGASACGSGATTRPPEASSNETTETFAPPPGLVAQAEAQAQAECAGAEFSKSPSSSPSSKQPAHVSTTYWGDAMMCSAIALQDPGWDDDQLKIPDAVRNTQPRQPHVLPDRPLKARDPFTKNKRRCEDTYQTVNFNSVLSGDTRGEVNTWKLVAWMHYLRRVTTKPPTGTITIERRVLQPAAPAAGGAKSATREVCSAMGRPNLSAEQRQADLLGLTGHMPAWAASENAIGDIRVEVDPSARIEQEGALMWKADFANCYPGGGVLQHGCVQEEILFTLEPELLVTMFLCESMDDNEAIIVRGAQRFSNYRGYGDTYEWDSPVQWKEKFQVQRDSWGRNRSVVFLIDAIPFYGDAINFQFRLDKIIREMNKFYCGIYLSGVDVPPSSQSTSNAKGNRSAAVATGNWGCGAFHGDKYLKAVIQILTAAQARRDLLYCTFGDDKLCSSIVSFMSMAQERQLRVQDMGKYFRAYWEYWEKRSHIKLNFRNEMNCIEFWSSTLFDPAQHH